MPKAGGKDIKITKSAKTGRFVTKGYAKGHPSTTFKQSVKRKSKKKK